MMNMIQEHYYPNITAYLEAIHVSHTQKHTKFHILKFEDNVGKIPKKMRLRKLGFFQVVISFDQDTIDLTLNGIDIVRTYILESDFSTGITELGIYQDDQGLWVQKGLDTQELKRLDLDGYLRVQIKINGKQTNLELKLKKGKIMVLDYCNVQTSHGNSFRTVTIRQHRKTVVFE